MSYRVYFEMSTGLSKPVTVPKGTLQKILERIQFTEESLGLVIEENPESANGKKYYKRSRQDLTLPELGPGILDETLCSVAEKHNSFVTALYEELEKYSGSPATDGEIITPEQSAEFWYGLARIDVPHARWTEDYYRARMDEIFESLRGRGDVIIFDSRALTPGQAADVINIFGNFLDRWDMRLDVPKGHDYLASSNDGGYYWCEKCGAVTEEDAANCRKRKCPVLAEWGEE